ncbi:MAG TPA: hypothetical protein VIC53_00805 [Wenzhouxiangella sp.]
MTRLNRLTALASVIFAALLLTASMAAQASVPTTQPGPDAARLSGSPGKATDDLFEVRFIEINGENILPREFVWLEPGTYTVKVAILADMTLPRLRGVDASGDQQAEGYNVIDLELEAGKTYHVRGRYHKDNEKATFSTVLHRVDDN